MHVVPVDTVRIATDVSTLKSGHTAVVETRVVDSISGKGVAHAPVTLWARGLHSGTWHEVGAQTGTKGDGSAHWTVQPDATTVYQVRAGHAGERAPATSGSAILTVH